MECTKTPGCMLIDGHEDKCRCGHKRIFEGVWRATKPPQHRYICEYCGERGVVVQETLASNAERFAQLMSKFHGAHT